MNLIYTFYISCCLLFFIQLSSCSKENVALPSIEEKETTVLYTKAGTDTMCAELSVFDLEDSSSIDFNGKTCEYYITDEGNIIYYQEGINVYIHQRKLKRNVEIGISPIGTISATSDACKVAYLIRPNRMVLIDTKTKDLSDYTLSQKDTSGPAPYIYKNKNSFSFSNDGDHFSFETMNKNLTDAGSISYQINIHKTDRARNFIRKIDFRSNFQNPKSTTMGFFHDLRHEWLLDDSGLIVFTPNRLVLYNLNDSIETNLKPFHEHRRCINMKISADGTKVALVSALYTYSGEFEKNIIEIIDLESGQVLSKKEENIGSSLAWNPYNSNEILFSMNKQVMKWFINTDFTLELYPQETSDIVWISAF